MQHSERGTDVLEHKGTSARRPVSPLTVLGVLLLVAGLACLGWVGWQYFGTNIVSQQQASKEISTLEQSWGQPSEASVGDGEEDVNSSAVAGSAQWLARIPAFGNDWEWPVVAGIEVEDLKKGVGWYPTTAQPGEVGNFALAGHRITNGEPFRQMLELSVGDTVIIETRDSVLTYELTSAPSQLTVQDTETWVLDPVPGHEDVAPSESLITLTTCEDLFHSPDRSVAFGKLVSTEAK